MGIEIEDRPFAKSTLQMFRAQLILHDKVREVFESSLRLARQSGYLKKRGMRVALDTTYILGRGAVKDTYNLLADGIVKLMRALAAVAKIDVREWAAAQRYDKYLGSSIKGEAAIDWSDRRARAALLAEIVADADRLLELARRAWVELPEDSAQRQSIVDGAELLGQLLLQNIERKSGDGGDGKVMLLPPQLLRPEAQPHPARCNIGLQSRQPVLQIGQPPPLLVNLLPPTPFLSLRNLPFRLSNSPLQAVHPQPLRRPHRRHLAVQRHPQRVEHPRRYPVFLDILALQQYRRPARRNVGKQLPLYVAVQFAVGRQPSIALRTVPAPINRDAGLVHTHQRARANGGLVRLATASWDET